MTLKRDIFIYIGLFFILLGIFVSVSVPSLFHILAAIPFLLYFKENIKNFKPSFSMYCLFGLMIWGVIASLYNFEDLSNPMRSFGKQKYILFSLLSLVAFPVFFKNYMTKKRIVFLVKTFLFTIVAAAIYGEAKARFGFDILKMQESGFNTVRNPGFTGIMRYGYGTGFVVSLLLGLVLNLKKIKNFLPVKWILVAVAFGLLGLLESQCRGAILGTICSIPFILLFKNKKLGVVSIILTTVGVLAIAGVMLFGGSQSSRLLQGASSPSNLIRLSQYEAAGRGIIDSPIFGLGTNQFSYSCPKIKEQHKIVWMDYCSKLNLKCDYSDYKPYCSHAHNIFLQTGADMGFIGLGLMFLWLVAWLFEMFKRKDLLGYLIVPIIVNILVAGQFEYIFDANNSFMIFLIYPLSYLKRVDLCFNLES